MNHNRWSVLRFSHTIVATIFAILWFLVHVHFCLATNTSHHRPHNEHSGITFDAAHNLHGNTKVNNIKNLLNYQSPSTNFVSRDNKTLTMLPHLSVVHNARTKRQSTEENVVRSIADKSIVTSPNNRDNIFQSTKQQYKSLLNDDQKVVEEKENTEREKIRRLTSTTIVINGNTTSNGNNINRGSNSSSTRNLNTVKGGINPVIKNVHKTKTKRKTKHFSHADDDVKLKNISEISVPKNYDSAMKSSSDKSNAIIVTSNRVYSGNNINSYNKSYADLNQILLRSYRNSSVNPNSTIFNGHQLRHSRHKKDQLVIREDEGVVILRKFTCIPCKMVPHSSSLSPLQGQPQQRPRPSHRPRYRGMFFRHVCKM